MTAGQTTKAHGDAARRDLPRSTSRSASRRTAPATPLSWDPRRSCRSEALRPRLSTGLPFNRTRRYFRCRHEAAHIENTEAANSSKHGGVMQRTYRNHELHKNHCVTASQLGLDVRPNRPRGHQRLKLSRYPDRRASLRLKILCRHRLMLSAVDDEGARTRRVRGRGRRGPRGSGRGGGWCPFKSRPGHPPRAHPPLHRRVAAQDGGGGRRAATSATARH